MIDDEFLARATAYARRLRGCGLSQLEIRRRVARDHGLTDEDALAAVTLADDETKNIEEG